MCESQASAVDAATLEAMIVAGRRNNFCVADELLHGVTARVQPQYRFRIPLAFENG